jgi:hypothetical protein
MTTIYECETEVGKCSHQPEDIHELKYAEPDFSLVFAHTVACLNGRHGMLKIEHHCYLRHGGEIPDQPWVKPEIVLEPAPGTKQDMVAFAKEQHLKFVERVRQQFPEEYLV